jgi:hypothetical protein
MSSWQAALIPLAIIAVLGSIAFFIGYRNLLSDERSNEDDQRTSPATGPRSAHSAQGQTALSPTEAVARRDELRARVLASDRLTTRAPQEHAVVVQYIDISVSKSTPIQTFVMELRRDFSDRITFVTRHFPTSDQGRVGAAALEAADRQGRFIPFLENLTAEPAGRADKVRSARPASSTASPPGTSAASSARTPRESVGARDYVKVARRLGMDGGEFARTMADPVTAAAIDADRAEASRAGITRAPALVLLDDQDHDVLTSLEDFRRAVEAAANR